MEIDSPEFTFDAFVCVRAGEAGWAGLTGSSDVLTQPAGRYTRLSSGWEAGDDNTEPLSHWASQPLWLH